MIIFMNLQSKSWPKLNSAVSRFSRSQPVDLLEVGQGEVQTFDFRWVRRELFNEWSSALQPELFRAERRTKAALQNPRLA